VSTISACLIVYHEEARIENCLESFADQVDEIIVVHDGPCHDESLSIARRFTDRVFQTDRRAGSSEFVRPFALRQCTSDWVLVIDADERLSPPLREAIRTLIDEPGVDAYGFCWPYVDETGVPVSSTSVAGKRFLFRRERMYTIGLPHMTPETYGVCRSTTLEVHHLLRYRDRSDTFRTLLEKNLRRGRAAAAKLAESANAIDLYNADLSDNRVKNARKIRMLARHPWFSLFVIPAWGFVYWYGVNGYFRAGWLGLHDALNLPLYYASFAYTLIRLRRRRKPANR
jgi:glycosyltransferase involved in cell wall biosynthesis